MELDVSSSLLGGMGLFLLGMLLLTNGLRLAAGQALQKLLETSTKTTIRGILTGISITSLVQSSSAVTVATLGFVNAGLIQLRQAITVIYGSNIGTTMTAWLVALVGFQVHVTAIALPAIGIGMVMKLFWNDKRTGAIGEALAGFGVFFLGIEVLKAGFDGMGNAIQFTHLSPDGIGLLLLVGSGFLMTVLMQSSSASMAIIITAAGGGVIPLAGAAAMVIGANVGTTSTALLATIGATPNAKRAAAAHVGFNLITGAVAILILPWMLALVATAESNSSNIPMILALFHSLFNLLGVALLWPFTSPMVGFLEQRFRSAEEDEARPRYLDRTLFGTPGLALQALNMELLRVAEIGRRIAKSAISAELGPGKQMTQDRNILEKLVIAAGEFCTSLQKRNLPAELAEALPNAIRVGRYYSTVSHLARNIVEKHRLPNEISDAELTEEINRFRSSVVQLIDCADPGRDGYTNISCVDALAAVQNDYQHLKARLLRAGTLELISSKVMVAQLELMSQIHRLAEQIDKGARYLASFRALNPAQHLEEHETNPSK